MLVSPLLYKNLYYQNFCAAAAAVATVRLIAEFSRKFLSLCIFVHHLFPKVTRSFFQLGRFWKMAVYKNAKTKNLPGTFFTLSSRVTIFFNFWRQSMKSSTLRYTYY